MRVKVDTKNRSTFKSSFIRQIIVKREIEERINGRARKIWFLINGVGRLPDLETLLRNGVADGVGYRGVDVNLKLESAYIARCRTFYRL